MQSTPEIEMKFDDKQFDFERERNLF